MNTLADIKSLPSGEYIRGGFVATISDARSGQTKTGKTFWKAKASDNAGNQAYLTSWGQTFEHFESQTVQFSGMGLQKKDDYNGVMQISISEKAKISPFTGATPTQTTPNAPKAPELAANAPSVVPGVTVGMAVNKAVDIAIAQGNTNRANIAALALELIEIALELQAGKRPAPSQAANQTGDDEDVPF
jgi:hypothetical protein